MKNDLREMWEAIAERKEREWKHLWGNNHTTGPLVYWRDVVPYKFIVRAARIKTDQPICWGASDCLMSPLRRCLAAKHDACAEHVKDCFLCKAEGEESK